MTVLRGEIWLAELNPVRGSEQAGTRPVLVMQTNAINRFTTTVLAIPFTPIDLFAVSLYFDSQREQYASFNLFNRCVADFA